MAAQYTPLPLATMLPNISPILIDASIKGAVLLAAAGLLTLALRRGSAAQRHLVWLLALGGTLALPVFSALLPAWRILPHWLGPSAVLTEESPAIESTTAPQTTDGESLDPKRLAEMRRQGPLHDSPQAADGGNAITSSPSIPVTPKWTARQLLEQGLLAIWIFGVAVQLFRYLLGMISVRRLGRQARPVDDEGWLTALDETARGLAVRQRVLLQESAQCTIPMTWGILRPVVLVPAQGKSWPAARRKVVLAHELAHVKRRDCLAQLVAQLARALYWLNPLAWLAWQRLLVESERACDDVVLAQGSKASDYAEHLLTVASGPLAGVLFSPAALAMARPSQLQGRLLAILDEKRNRRRLTRFAVAAALLLVAGSVVPLSVLKAVADDRGTLLTGRRATDEPPAAPAGPAPASSGGKSNVSSQTPEKRTGESPAPATLSVNEVVFDDDGPASQGGAISIPSYQELGSPEILKAVALSEKQKKELLQISQAWSALMKRWEDMAKTSQNLSPQQRQEKQEKFERDARQLQADCRKKVEALLTPAQMETYKRLALPNMAYSRLFDPALLKRIALSKEQQERIKQLQKPFGLVTTGTREKDAELLAILDQEQQKKLRAEVERDYFATSEARAEAMAFMDDTIYNAAIGPIADSEPASPPKFKGPFFMLPVYEPLGNVYGREHLGISAAQEKQLQEIAAKYEAARKRLRQAEKSLTPAEREAKWPELRRQSVTAATDVRRQIDALLTPQQLVAVKDAIVDMYLPMNLNLNPGPHYNLVEKIGLSDKQMAALRRKRQESIDKSYRAFREFQEKLFAVLTPEQKQTLRQEIDRSGW